MRQPFSILSIVALAAVAAFVLWQASPADENDAPVPPAGAVAPPLAAAEAASGDVLLDSAVAALESHTSVAARVRIQVDLFGHQLFGPGRYLQQGRGGAPKFRFELALQTTNGKVALVHVSDGDQLWLFEDFGGGGELSYVGLTTLRQSIKEAAAGAATKPPTPRSLDPSRQSIKEAAAGAAPPRQEWMTGGLPKLLTGLQTNFHFAGATQVQRKGVLVWRLKGGWRAERLAALLGGASNAAATDPENPAKKLPVQMPTDVVLYLDARTLFPVQLEFYRQGNSATASAAKPLLVMELSEQSFGLPIDDSQFQRPSGLPLKDVTDKFLQRVPAVEPR